jgi:hypothetical protein
MRTDTQIDRQTDRQTDMTKLIVAFRNFAKAPNNIQLHYLGQYITSMRQL